MVYQEQIKIVYSRENGAPLTWHLLESCWHCVNGSRLFKHPGLVFNILFFVEHGSAHVVYGKRDLQLEKGDVALIPINSVFEVTYTQNELFAFHFTMRGTGGLDVFGALDGPVHFGGRGALFEPVRRFFYDKINHDGRDRTNPLVPQWESAVFSFCYEVASSFMPRNSIANLCRGTQYEKLLDRVHAHIGADMSVGGLAKWLRISRAALSKGFQRKTGVSLKNHLAAMLFQRMRERLAHTDLTVLQIADELRFRDPTHFHHFFRRFTNMTPLEYRAKFQQNLL